MPTEHVAFIRLAALAAVLAVAAPARAQTQTVGLFVNDARASDGYTLITPLLSDETFLIDIDGHPVNRWTASGPAGLMGYLTEEGHLLRAVSIAPAVDPHWTSAIGGGGRLEEYDWDGNLVWTLDWSDALKHQHHDFKKLPNGNVLLISWEWKSAAEAIAAGRNPGLTVGGAFWPDVLYEIQPTPPSGGTVVWEWHVFDHLVQDIDATKANYGVLADHPELINANGGGDDGNLDFNHLNAVAYNPELDQIAMSSRAFNEIWIIDHSTTTAEAASHSGGRYGRGGDLLYRWGNPFQYRRGTATDKTLFNQHDVQWVPPGYPGEGSLLIFNNGLRRPDGSTYSSADEIVPPILPDGSYDITSGSPYGPAAPVWTYTGTPRSSFLSPIIAGVQRMPNGNTLIDEGTKGNIFEVTPAGEIVWRYVNPLTQNGPLTQGGNIPGQVFAQDNAVFKMRRYPADYPGLAGRTLTPGEPLEIFNPPSPVPDGSAGTSPVRASKLDAAGTSVQVTWDATSCTSADYDMFWGPLSGVSTLTIAGSDCAMGTSGTHDWMTAPAGNSWFLLVGVGDFPIYESSWGKNSFGVERNGYRHSRTCLTTTKSLALTCP